MSIVMCHRSRISFTDRILRVTIRAMHLHPWNTMLTAIAVWMSREQVAVIEYLKEEYRVLRELPGKKRPRLNND